MLQTAPLEMTKSFVKQITVDSFIKLCMDTLFHKNNQQPIKQAGIRESVGEMITVMLEEDPENSPSYVAVDLSNLPPVGKRDVDSAQLLSEIKELRASVALLTAGHKDLIHVAGQATDWSTGGDAYQSIRGAALWHRS